MPFPDDESWLNAADEEATWACALRYDGYAFTEARPEFDFRTAVKPFFAAGNWEHLSLDERMGALFVLQRFLNKGGGDRRSPTAPDRRAYYSLFLDLCRLPVSPADGEDAFVAEYRVKWEQEYTPRLAAIEARVRTFYAAMDWQAYQSGADE